MCKTFFAAQKSLNKSLIGRVTRCRGRENVRLAGNLSARSMMLFAFLYLRTQRIPVFILSFSYIYFLINFPVCLLVFSCSSCLPPSSSFFISLHSSSPCSVIPPLPLSLVLLLFHHFFVFSSFHLLQHCLIFLFLSRHFSSPTILCLLPLISRIFVVCCYSFCSH